MVVGWDLGLAMKKRSREDAVVSRPSRSRWERLTGWTDDSSDEEDEDEYVASDGDVLGYSKDNKRRGSSSKVQATLASEWEMDMNAFESGQVCCSDIIEHILLIVCAVVYVSNVNAGAHRLD